MFKKILAFVTAAAVTLTLAACGKEKPELTEGGKKIVTIYAFTAGDDIKKAVGDFNGKSEEYRIKITEYAEEYPDDPLTRLNNDIIAGKLPDIIILDAYNMPVDSYISKGLLANLYDFMDSDEAFNKADYLDSYFKAYEVNGKLYEIAPAFVIQTIVGKASTVGEAQGWTMNEFISFADANPDRNIFSGIYNKGNILTFFINSCCGDYFNRETGECSFNGDDFIGLLEFCNRFPNETPENYYDTVDLNAYEAQWRTGDTLLDFGFISDFTSLREYEIGTFGEPVTVKGYPAASGNGLSFNNYGIELAIAAKTGNAEGAWEFLKYFLSDEYQDQSYFFPIKLSSLEKKAEASKDRPFWTDDNGEKQYYDNTLWIGGQEISVGVNTDEDIRRVMEIIKSADSVWRNDGKISEIVAEEAAAYFAGQKSAEDVAEIIQNRVQNYIEERR